MYSVADFEEAARKALPSSLFSYIASGSGGGQALAGNIRSMAGWNLVPKVLVDVSAREQATELFGRVYASPFGIAPMGIAALCRFDGDRCLARAAADENVPYILSGASTTRLEDVLEVNEHAWFQAYLSSNWELTEPLLKRVWSSGCRTLVVTVDVPVAAIRAMELRAGFSVPLKPSLKLAVGAALRPGWLAGTLARTIASQGIPHFENLRAGRGGPLFTTSLDHRANRAGLSWSSLRQIRDAWKGNLVIKGVLQGSDAQRAAQVGADGVIVSNHGGRQVDCAVAPISVLREVAQAAPGVTVMVDSGFRSGTDILKALALGARCVFVGRPVMFGLASFGTDGARKVLALLRTDVDINLALVGCPTVNALNEDYLRSCV